MRLSSPGYSWSFDSLKQINKLHPGSDLCWAHDWLLCARTEAPSHTESCDSWSGPEPASLSPDSGSDTRVSSQTSETEHRVLPVSTRPRVTTQCQLPVNTREKREEFDNPRGSLIQYLQFGSN